VEVRGEKKTVGGMRLEVRRRHVLASNLERASSERSSNLTPRSAPPHSSAQAIHQAVEFSIDHLAAVSNFF